MDGNLAMANKIVDMSEQDMNDLKDHLDKISKQKRKLSHLKYRMKNKKKRRQYYKNLLK
jgi:hypothetical protein